MTTEPKDWKSTTFDMPGMVIKVFMDGDQYCAVMGDFENLQESDAGFASNPVDAICSLIHVRSHIPTPPPAPESVMKLASKLYIIAKENNTGFVSTLQSFLTVERQKHAEEVFRLKDIKFHLDVALLKMKAERQETIRVLEMIITGKNGDYPLHLSEIREALTTHLQKLKVEIK